MNTEHRTDPRRRTLKTGSMSFANDNRGVECQIRNLSETGACLVVPPTIAVPPSFSLIDMHAGVRHEVEVMWRAGNRIGVRFIIS